MKVSYHFSASSLRHNKFIDAQMETSQLLNLVTHAGHAAILLSTITSQYIVDWWRFGRKSLRTARTHPKQLKQLVFWHKLNTYFFVLLATFNSILGTLDSTFSLT